VQRTSAPLPHSRVLAPPLVFLLALRFLLLGGIRFVTWPDYPEWLLPVYEVATYLLVAALFYVCRNRLSEYHTTPLALALFILAPLLAPSGFRMADLMFRPVDWLVCGAQAIIGVALAAALLRKQAQPLTLGRDRPTYLLLSAAVGILLGLTFGSYFLVHQYGQQLAFRQATLIPGGILSLIGLAIIQLHGAAILEEPLFRGLGWGGLRDLGLNDLAVFLLQAALFSVSHIYYVRFAPFSMWLLVPSVGLALGLLAWRTRSIAATMIAHALINAIAIAWGRA